MITQTLQAGFNNAIEKYKDSFYSIDAQYLAFAIFGLINFTMPVLFDQEYPSLLRLLHWIGLTLCTSLIFIKPLAENFSYFAKYYWFFCLFFCLSFFVFCGIFITYASSDTILNTILSFFILILLTDWLISITLLTIGLISSLIFLHLFMHHTHVSWDYYLRGYDLLKTHYYISFYFVWALVISVIFLKQTDKKKENLKLKKQINITKTIASSIAHELRTPLLIISATLQGFDRYVPKLINAYELAKRNNIKVANIPDELYSGLKRALGTASNEITTANTIIDILLIRLRGVYIDQSSAKSFSITNCIDEAIKKFPYDAKSHKKLIHFSPENNFKIHGIQVIVIHIFFNLIKNALYHIEKAGKGDINIWIERTKKYNIVYFKDTGTGINKKHLPYIFKEFFSKTQNGAGVGLAFCQLAMKELQGSIKAKSVEGEYTLFILKFPEMH